MTDGSNFRKIHIIDFPETPPSCCAYSNNGTGYPCRHRVSVLSEKYGLSTLYIFVTPRHHTAAWNAKYDGVTCNAPPQADMDEVIVTTKISSLLEIIYRF